MVMEKDGQVRRHLEVWMVASDTRSLVCTVNLSSKSFAMVKGSPVQMG
jgi:hypothetical protein